MQGRRQAGGGGHNDEQSSSVASVARAPAPSEAGTSKQGTKKQQPEQRRRTMSNSFMTLRYKISMCKRPDPHNWRLCPYAHEGEAGRRRPPHMYKAVMCEFAKADCPLGDVCTFAHNALEYWLHPDKYRTTLCGQGEACNRNVCFFAHNHNELRIPGGDVAAKSSRSKFGPSADPAAELLAQLSLGAGSSRGSSSQQAQRPHMQQQQAAHMGLGVPVAYRDGAAAGAGGSGRGAFLHLAMPAPADSSQRLWMTQQQGMSDMVAQQGADTAMFAAALTAVAAGGGGPLDQTQLRPELVAQAALQAVPLMAMQGAVPDVQAGALAPGAAAAVAAAAAAAGTYPGYNPVPQQQQQQMVRPAAEALMRLAAQQQQASMVRGVTAAQHGWVPGLAAVPAGYAGSAGHGPAQQQPMYAVAGVHGQAAGPQPMWAPQGVQVYGSMPMAAISSPPTGYAAAWPVQAMQQLQPGVLAHQVLQGVHVHSGAVMPGMQGAHTHGMVEEPTSGEVLANVHRSSEHAGFLKR